MVDDMQVPISADEIQIIEYAEEPDEELDDAETEEW